MLKKHSKIKLIIISIIALLGILLCVCSFSVPYSQNNFNGFLGAINKGIELDGGIEVIYSCSLKEGEDSSLEENMNDAVSKLESLYSQLSFNEFHINKLGDNQIQLLLSSEARVAEEIYEYVTTSKGLYMTLTESKDANKYVFAEDIKEVKINYDYENSKHGVNLFFTNAGKADIENLKKHADDMDLTNAYLYWGDELFASLEIDSVKDGMFVTSDSISYDSDALKASHNILVGSMGVNFDQFSVHTITPALGANASTCIIIILALIIVASFVFMYIRYGHFGLLSSLAAAFYLVLFVFFMQAIPLILMNLAGVVASVIAYLIAVGTQCYLFEKTKEEYALGKKIHLSCKGAFKRALWPILDSHIALALAAICLWIFAPANLTIVGIILLTGAILSVFTSLVLTRFFVHLYLPLNSTKPQKLRLYRDKNVKEIKEEVEIIVPQSEEGNNE